MRILAIDQSSTSICGWSVLDNEILVDKGLIFLKNCNKCMAFLREAALSLIHTYQPDIICWEDLKTDRNPDTIRKLGESTGVLREICETYNYQYREYIPISVKAKICIKKTGARGRATKADLGLRIAELYNLDFPYDEIFTVYKKGKNKGQEKINEKHQFLNITDAIGLALYHYKYGSNK